MQLSSLSQRILGALIEKAMATPQSYPLSVNALTAAANQTTNRDPVSSWTEAQVSEGLKELAGRSLVRAAYARRSSTPRYEHLLDAHLEIDEAAVAVLCVLLLRGPQTLGELRQRTDRLHAFADLSAVQDALTALAGHHFGALVEEAPRQPGQKETRWRHLLGTQGDDDSTGEAPGDDPASAEEADPAPAVVGSSTVAALQERIGALEDRVAGLEEQLRRLSTFVGA